MTNKEAAKILAARVECKRCIYRNCDECELCYAQGTFKELIEAVVIAIKALEQQEEPGEWIEDAQPFHVEKTYHCSKCGHPAWGYIEKTKYCPGCGAVMRGVGI